MSSIDPAPYQHGGAVLARLLIDLVGAAGAALSDSPLGIPGLVAVGHADPPEDCCDALLIWTQSRTPTVRGGFPEPMRAAVREGGSACKHWDLSLDVRLSLRRACTQLDFSGQKEDRDPAFAVALLIDSTALECAVKRDWPAVFSAVFGVATGPPVSVQYGAMVPTGKGSDCQGWDWPIRIETRSCDCKPPVP